MTCQGAAHLAEKLGNLQALRMVELSNNKIGDVGAERIAIALRSVESLVKVYLKRAQISPVGEAKVASILGQHVGVF